MPHLFIFSGGRIKFWILLAWVPHLGGASSNAENRVVRNSSFAKYPSNIFLKNLTSNYSNVIMSVAWGFFVGKLDMLE